MKMDLMSANLSSRSGHLLPLTQKSKKINIYCGTCFISFMYRELEGGRIIIGKILLLFST